MRYEKQFFNFAMASGIASAEMRFKNASYEVQERAETLQTAVHLILAEWGVFPDYMKHASEVSGIDAEGYFDDYLKVNAEEKVELTKEVLFETAYEKGMTATFMELVNKQEQDDKHFEHIKAQVNIFDMFFEVLGIEDEYNEFLDSKIRDLLN